MLQCMYVACPFQSIINLHDPSKQSPLMTTPVTHRLGPPKILSTAYTNTGACIHVEASINCLQSRFQFSV